jgi:hypothetical protein
MVVLALVNMLFLLVGFLTRLRKKSLSADRGIGGDSAANQACTE